MAKKRSRRPKSTIEGRHVKMRVATPDPVPGHTHPIADFLSLDGRYPEISSKVLLNLSPGDIVQVSRTCKAFLNVYKEVQAAQWNINRRLAWFFDDPVAFRTELGRANAIISGGFALQFLARVVWKESDLDIFVKAEPAADRLQKWLCTQEHYAVSKVQPDDERGLPVHPMVYQGNNIFKVVTLSRSAAGERNVQLVYTVGTPVESVVGNFYTTAVMNIITWNRSFALFPVATFEKHCTYLMAPWKELHIKLLDKYKQRGWQVLERPSDSAEFDKDRRIGDASTWIMDLATQGVQRPEMQDFVMNLCFFTVSLQTSQSEASMTSPMAVVQTYYTGIKSYRFQRMQWDYTFSNDDDYNRGPSHGGANSRLKGRGLPDQWSRGFWFGVVGWILESGRLEGGLDGYYFDDLLPAWFSKWSREPLRLGPGRYAGE